MDERESGSNKDLFCSHPCLGFEDEIWIAVDKESEIWCGYKSSVQMT